MESFKSVCCVCVSSFCYYYFISGNEKHFSTLEWSFGIRYKRQSAFTMQNSKFATVVQIVKSTVQMPNLELNAQTYTIYNIVYRFHIPYSKRSTFAIPNTDEHLCSSFSDFRIDFKQFIRIIRNGFRFRFSFSIRSCQTQQNGIEVDQFRNCIMQNMRHTYR